MTGKIKTDNAELQKQTRLNITRPDAQISLTAPAHYLTLLEHIQVHRYYLGLEWQRTVSLEEAAAHWYDTVYLPVVKAIRGTGVLKGFPGRTEPDLYVWMAYHRERLATRYGRLLSDEEVARVLKERFSGRPVLRLIKSLRRALKAAMHAAAESPEPPRFRGEAGPEKVR